MLPLSTINNVLATDSQYVQILPFEPTILYRVVFSLLERCLYAAWSVLAK